MNKENILKTYMDGTYSKTVQSLQSAQKERNGIATGGQTPPQSDRYAKLINKCKK